MKRLCFTVILTFLITVINAQTMGCKLATISDGKYHLTLNQLLKNITIFLINLIINILKLMRGLLTCFQSLKEN